MIIDDKAAAKRLNSPLNLINRLNDQKNGRAKHAMDLFGLNRSAAPQNGKKENNSSTSEAKCEWSFQSNKTGTSNNPSTNPSTEIIPRNGSHNGYNSINNEGTQKSNGNENKEHLEGVKTDDLIDNADNQLELSQAHNNALKLMTASINQLSAKLDNVRADRLPAVITAASKVVENIRKERSEAAKGDKEKDVHYHFYVPVQKKIADYGEVIDVEGVKLDQPHQ